MSNINDVFTEFLDGNRDPVTFAAHRELSDEQRKKYSNSAASLVEEILLRMPNGAWKVEITHGEGVMLRELFEQVVIDLDALPDVDTYAVEEWRKCRIEGLERITRMVHIVIISNILLRREV